MTNGAKHAAQRTLILLSLAVVLGMTILVVAATGSTSRSAQNPSSLKIAFMYPSPRSDGGWSQAHDQGRLALEKAFRGKVTTVYKENVPESPQAKQVINSLLQDGADVIFAASYGYHGYIAEAAKSNPDVYFFQLQSTELGPNLSEYNAALEDAAYLAGMAAGAASKNGKLGMTAEFPVPSVTNYVNGFALGARAVNPKAVLRVLWTNSWYDPPAEAVAARSLISSGVSVLAQNQNSSATGKQAEAAGVPFVGSFWHMQNVAPKQFLTGAIFLWANYYIPQVRAIFNGTWKSSSAYPSMKERVVALDSFGPQYKLVSKKNRAKIAAVKKKLQAGTYNIYTGPIYDTNGKLRVKAGQTLPLVERFSMSWFPSNVRTNVKSK